MPRRSVRGLRDVCRDEHNIMFAWDFRSARRFFLEIWPVSCLVVSGSRCGCSRQDGSTGHAQRPSKDASGRQVTVSHGTWSRGAGWIRHAGCRTGVRARLWTNRARNARRRPVSPSPNYSTKCMDRGNGGSGVVRPQGGGAAVNPDRSRRRGFGSRDLDARQGRWATREQGLWRGAPSCRRQTRRCHGTVDGETNRDGAVPRRRCGDDRRAVGVVRDEQSIRQGDVGRTAFPSFFHQTKRLMCYVADADPSSSNIETRGRQVRGR